jgi:hypothetical protein
VFEDECLSIYNTTQLSLGEKELSSGARAGFCDGLVSLIGQPLLGVSQADGLPLKLRFEGGAILSVLAGGVGPEAWQFNSNEGKVVVHQNA